MKLPKASMTTTLFVILVFAVDFGVARDLLSHDRGQLSLCVPGSLPMATALVFGLYRLGRLRGRAGAFTVGFVVAGLVASVAYLAAIQLVPAVADSLDRLVDPMDRMLGTMLPSSWTGEGKVLTELDLTAPEWLVDATILSLPPFLVALAGGFLAHRIAPGRGEAARRRERASHRPRFTLSPVGTLIAALAVDFGLIRLMVANPWTCWTTFGIGFLPMANVLVLGLPRTLAGRGRRGPFLLGFEVVGWLATLAYLAACAVDPEAVMGQVVGFNYHVLFVASDSIVGSGRTQEFFTNSSYLALAANILLVVPFFTLPPLLLALFGGAINRRFGRRQAGAA